MQPTQTSAEATGIDRGGLRVALAATNRRLVAPEYSGPTFYVPQRFAWHLTQT
jgi:hypothetical protein